MEVLAKDGSPVCNIWPDGTVHPPSGWFVELAMLVDNGTVSRTNASKVISYWYEWFWSEYSLDGFKAS
jgi:hypothetical protein